MSMSFAIGAPLDRLLSSQTGLASHAAVPAPAAPPRREAPLDASGSQTPAFGLSAMLGRLGVEREASPTDVAGAAVRPNIDALNRVLNHYAAQSAGADSIISLVRS